MRILMTGGSGLLGQELRRIWNKTDRILAPTHLELNVADDDSVHAYKARNIDLIIHLAAYTSVHLAEYEIMQAFETNCIGTRNMALMACRLSIPMLYLSTDYVFSGEKGEYCPLDIPNPINYYGLTKLMGEKFVSGLDNYLIIRTSFKPSKWKYQYAYVNQITTADYVDVIAPKIIKAMDVAKRKGIMHIGTKPKSMYDLAKQRNPKILAAKIDKPYIPRTLVLTNDNKINPLTGQYRSLVIGNPVGDYEDY